MNHSKSRAFGRWLKNNLALIIIVSCVVAIVGIVLVATLTPDPPVVPVDTDVPNGQDTGIVDDPLIPIDEPITPPEQTSEVFLSPMENYTLGMTFTDNVENLFVFNNTLGRWESHRAVDLVAPTGTAVSSMKSGTVVKVGYSYGLGNYVEIDHGEGVVATYASLDNVTVTQGQEVVGGDKIGETSETANYEFKDGAHLHLSVTVNGELVDPLPLFTTSAE